MILEAGLVGDQGSLFGGEAARPPDEAVADLVEPEDAALRDAAPGERIAGCAVDEHGTLVELFYESHAGFVVACPAGCESTDDRFSAADRASFEGGESELGIWVDQLLPPVFTVMERLQESRNKLLRHRLGRYAIG